MADDRERLERIRRRAYQLWENAGRPQDDDLSYWFSAEREEAGRQQAGEVEAAGETHWKTAPSATPTPEEARQSGRRRKVPAPKPEAASNSDGNTATRERRAAPPDMTESTPPQTGPAPATPAAQPPIRRKASSGGPAGPSGLAGERPAPATDAEDVPGDPAKAPARSRK